MTFSPPTPALFKDKPMPTRAEHELLAKTARDLAEERDALRRRLSTADEQLTRLRTGSRSALERALKSEVEELLAVNAQLDDRLLALTHANQDLEDELARMRSELASAAEVAS